MHLASDVDPSGGRDAVVAALAGLGAAIELVDLDPDADDPEDILSRNIFQRAVLLGPVQDVRDTHDLRLRVLVDGEEAVETRDIIAADGMVFDAVASVAQTLAEAGERLSRRRRRDRRLDLPALELEPGQEVVVELEPGGWRSSALDLVVGGLGSSTTRAPGRVEPAATHSRRCPPGAAATVARIAAATEISG